LIAYFMYLPAFFIIQIWLGGYNNTFFSGVTNSDHILNSDFTGTLSIVLVFIKHL